MQVRLENFLRIRDRRRRFLRTLEIKEKSSPPPSPMKEVGLRDELLSIGEPPTAAVVPTPLISQSEIADIPTYGNHEVIPDPFLSDEKKDPRVERIRSIGRWRLTPLYTNSIKGQPMFWWIGFDIKGEEIITGHGYVGGVEQTKSRRVTVNQSGRTLHEQAVLEIRQRYLKKFRQGYHPHGSEAPSVSNPMLANKWQPAKTRLYFPVLVQPKLDGGRALVRRVADGRLVYRSRSNREYPHLGQIFDQELALLISYLPLEVELDGELYLHGKSFNQLSSILRNERQLHPQINELKYYIFDFNSHDPQPAEIRAAYLRQAEAAVHRDGYTTSHLVIVPTYPANNGDEIKSYHQTFRASGFEGTMIRKTRASGAPLAETIYKSGRSNNLLKYKDIQDEEGVVIGVGEAQGQEEGLALLIIQDPRGNRIQMRPAFSFEERSKWLQQPELVIGKRITYEFGELSEYGVPRFPVAKAFRDYE